MTDNDGTVVYSYVWFHKKGTELEANKETCKLIEDQDGKNQTIT